MTVADESDEPHAEDAYEVRARAETDRDMLEAEQHAEQELCARVEADGED